MKQLNYCLVILCYVTICCAAKSDKGSKPNIIFILADDYGYNDIGYHGSDIKTPNLDALAASGVKLENYYVQPICTPTRSQLMTGRYQIHTGLQHLIIYNQTPSGLPLDSPTIAEKLKESGYHTHMVGKWHLGFYKKEYTPTYRGFDTFYGFYGSEEGYFSHSVDQWDPSYLDLRNQEEPVRNETGHYSTHLFTSKTIDVINDHIKSTPYEPFFLYLSYQAVHAPPEAPDEYLQDYTHIKWENRRKYAGMVAAMDEGIGNLTKFLTQNDLLKNTVLVFSTDNGGKAELGGANYPLRGEKNSYFEGGMRAIGFVSGFGIKHPGSINKELIHVSDWYPTFLHLAGGSAHGTKPLDGVNQWETISSNAVSARDTILHNIDPLRPRRGNLIYYDTFDHRMLASLRWGSMKLITGNPGVTVWYQVPKNEENTVTYKDHNEPNDKNIWLFNITEDPTEKNDLSAQEPDIVKTMLDMLSDFHKTSVPVFFPDLDPDFNPAKFGNVLSPWQ